ncbi:MAG: hypothetical protein NTV34_09335, partial [Proteobacteria bacterium]|nr:hypothetical protein [Pseudomonadota bacterium]
MAKNDVYSPCYCGSGKKFKFCCFEDEKSSNQFNFPAPAKTNTFQKISQRCLQSLSPHSPEANSHRSTGPETIKEIVRDFIQNNSRWSAVISKTPGLLKFAKFFNPKDVDMEFSLKLITVTYSSKLFPEIKFAIDSSGYFIAQDEQNIEAFVGLMWALFGDSKRQHSRSDDKADLIIAYIASRFNLDGFDLYKFKLGGIVLPVDGFHPSENLELSKQTHHLMKDLFSSHAKPANGIYSWNGSEVEFSDSAKFPDGAYFVFTNGDIISFSLMSRHSYQELLPPKLKKIVRDFSAKRDRGRSLLYSFGRDFVQVKTVDALPLFFDYLQKAEKSGQPNKVKTYFIARETKSVFDPSIDKVALSEITSASSLKDSALTLELKYPNVAVHLVSGTHYDACKVDHEFFYARKTQELIKLNVRGIDRVLGGSSGNRYYMPVAKLPPGVVMGGILSPAMTPRQGVESLSLINGLNQAVAGQVQFSAKEEVPSKLIHNRICFYTDKPHRLDWSLVIGDGRPPKASESAMADSSRLLTGVPPVVAQIMVLAIDGFRGLWDYLERRYYEHIETSNAKLVARHRGLGLCLAAELSALLVESTASEDEASQED